MSEKPNSSVEASLPRKSVKFSVRGRNYNAFRVNLGQRIMLGEFFGELMKAVLGDDKLSFSDMTNDDRVLGMIMSRLPDVFRAVEGQYVAIAKDCTDIDPATLESEFELEDLVTVFKSIWDANGFTETMKAIGASAKKKDGAGRGGSKG